MDPQVSSSFIPKKTLESSASRVSGSSTGLILLIAILIFVASLVAAASVFAYQGILKQSIASKKNSLALNEKAYDPGVIQELIRVDSRITEAGTLLRKHIAPSAIFVFLSQQTLEKVQLTSLDYSVDQNGDSKITLTGVADSFSTIALQSDQFGASKVLKDVVFSDVAAAGDAGKIGFGVTATIVGSLTLYSNALAASPAAGEESTEPPAATTSTQTP